MRGPDLIASLGITIATALPPALAGAMAVPLLSALDVSHSAFGGAIAAFFLTNAFVSPWAGHLADQIGNARSVLLAVGLAALSMLGIAAFGTNYPVFVGFFLLGGFGAAVAGPAGSILLARAAGVRWQPLLFSIRQALVPAASLIGGIAVPIFAGFAFGWRIAFLIGGVLIIPLAFTGRSSAPVRQASTSPRTGVSDFRVHELWLFSLVFALSGAAANAVTTFAVDYASATHQTPLFGGMTLAAASGAAISARIIVGYGVSRFGLDTLKATAAMLVIGVGGFAWIALGPAWAILPGSILGMAGAWGWSGLLIYSVTFGFGRNPGRANGIVLAGGATGGILGPLVTGWAVQTWSYTTAWILAALFVLISMFVIAAMLVSRRKRTRTGVSGL